MKHLLLAMALGAAAFATDASAQAAKPTVVLVHGAFADASSWNGVIRILGKDGYPVVAVANPLRGVASDGAYVGDVVTSLAGPVVLVGHSYGGAVITGAARDQENVRALVYVAAFDPDEAESANELATRFPGSTLGDSLRVVPLSDGSNDLYIQADKFHHQFAAEQLCQLE